MHLDHERLSGSWTDRVIVVKDDTGSVVEELGEHPQLYEIRDAERRYGERLNIWNAGAVCSECNNIINPGERFGADAAGNLLCQNCATGEPAHEQNETVVNSDPTKATLSESRLHKKSLCDYVVNVATGCRHGCKFCYVPSTPAINNREEMLSEEAGVDDVQEDWGSYLLYRDDLPERLGKHLDEMDESDWKETDRGRGVVMLSSGTDCYQDRRAGQITHGAIRELISRDIPVRVLTRSPAVARDVELFEEAGDLITVGSSIPSFDEALVNAIEPNAPPPRKRYEALQALSDQGVRVFVSMSPTYPTKEEEFWYMMEQFEKLGPEVVFHEPVNPRGSNFELLQEAMIEAGFEEMAETFETLQDESKWVTYAIEQINFVQGIADEFVGVKVHSWPDRELISATSGELRSKLKEMRRAVSPESFRGREPIMDESQTQLASTSTALQNLI